jgi:hypothetical protein
MNCILINCVLAILVIPDVAPLFNDVRFVSFFVGGKANHFPPFAEEEFTDFWSRDVVV